MNVVSKLVKNCLPPILSLFIGLSFFLFSFPAYSQDEIAECPPLRPLTSQEVNQQYLVIFQPKEEKPVSSSDQEEAAESDKPWDWLDEEDIDPYDDIYELHEDDYEGLESQFVEPPSGEKKTRGLPKKATYLACDPSVDSKVAFTNEACSAGVVLDEKAKKRLYEYDLTNEMWKPNEKKRPKLLRVLDTLCVPGCNPKRNKTTKWREISYVKIYPVAPDGVLGKPYTLNCKRITEKGFTAPVYRVIQKIKQAREIKQLIEQGKIKEGQCGEAVLNQYTAAEVTVLEGSVEHVHYGEAYALEPRAGAPPNLESRQVRMGWQHLGPGYGRSRGVQPTRMKVDSCGFLSKLCYSLTDYDEYPELLDSYYQGMPPCPPCEEAAPFSQPITPTAVPQPSPAAAAALPVTGAPGAAAAPAEIAGPSAPPLEAAPAAGIVEGQRIEIDTLVRNDSNENFG